MIKLLGPVWIACIVAATTAVLSRPAPEVAASAPPAPLPFYYDLYTFRAEGGGTAVVAAIAVEVMRLGRERVEGEFRYRFDVRFVVADTARRAVISTGDSVYLGTPRPLARRHLLHTYVEVRAPPSTTTLQRVILTDATRPGVGQLYRSPFPVPDYSGSKLMLSDIAFGLPGASGGWTRREATLALLPTSQFPESSFDVYYEIYNLPSGTPYETEISIQSLDEDNDDDIDEDDEEEEEEEEEVRIVRTVFSGESAARPDGSVSELRRVDSALARGRYRLTVTVRDQITGQVAHNSRVVEVRGWRRGATLIHARPYGARAREEGRSMHGAVEGAIPW